jgi:hypothetical protein
VTDPLLLEALRKLNEAAELLRLVAANGVPQEEIDQPFLSQRLDRLTFGPGYGVRLQRMFESHREYVGGEYIDAPLVTVRDLIALSEADILREPNIGKQCLSRLKAMLAPHGLHFGMRDVDRRLRSVA